MTKIFAIFAPHPDDETLTCGGTIAQNIKYGHEVYIIFMTDGRYSHQHTLGIDMSPTPNDIKHIRREEARQATATLGVKPDNLSFLEYEDGSLNDCIEPACIEVQTILKRIKPDVVVCPAKIDKHKDHKATHIVVYKAIQLLKIQPELLQYVVWQNRKHAFRQVKTDISDVLSIKKKALAAYKSQITLFSPGQRRPILIKRFLNKFTGTNEAFYQE